MKNISFLLVFLLLLQSCSVYNIPTTLDAAVGADKKVKVITTDNQKYKFKRLEKKDDKIVGINPLGSSNSFKFAGLPTQIDGKLLVTDLSNVDIEKIKLRNKSASTGLTVVTIAGTLLLTFFTIFLIGFAQTDLWGSGDSLE